MGQVFAGRRQAGEAEVAVKVLSAGEFGDSGEVARFQREVEAMRSLRHPHIVRILDWGRDGQLPWLAMELVEGESLDRLLEHGPLSGLEAVELVEPVADALAHAHERGVLHRDLKPANVILRYRDAKPLLTDFGLARRLDRSQGLTQTGEIVGSPGFLAPEQCGSGERPGPRVDVYGLGALLYALVTGQPPCPGATVIDAVRAVLESVPRSPSSLARGPLDPVLEALIMRCLDKDPAARPSSVRGVQRELRVWREGQRRARVAAGSSPAALAGVAILVAFGLGVAGTMLAGGGGQVASSPAPPALVGGPAPTRPLASPTVPPGSASPEPGGSPQRASGDVSGGPLLGFGGAELPAGSPRLEHARERVEALFLAGSPQSALRFLSSEIAREPAAMLFFLRGCVFGQSSRWAEAEQAFTEALSHDPELLLESQIYAKRGCARGRLGKLEAEERDYRRSIELEPKQALAYLYRAWACYVARRQEEAILNYGKALEHHPSARVYANRGLIHMELRQHDRARADLARALELDPQSPFAQKLERLLRTVERLDWAVKRLGERDFGPEVEAALVEAWEGGMIEAGYRLAVLYSLSGRRPEGERLLEEAARAGHRTAAYELYRERLRQRRYEDARHLLERSVQLGSFVGMIRRGRLLLERAREGAPRAREHRAAALRIFQAAYAGGQADGLAWVGKVRELAGDEAEAERCYRQAAKEGSARACTHLARLVAARGDAEERSRLLLQARNRRDPRALAMWAWRQANSQDPKQQERGLKMLRNACFLGGVRAHLRLAEIMLKQARQEEAVHLLEQLAEEGFVEGMVALGALLTNDRLDASLRDMVGAALWLRRADELMHPDAEPLLARVVPALRSSQDPRAAWALAWWLHRAGRSAEARPLLERAAAGGVRGAVDLLKEAYR